MKGACYAFSALGFWFVKHICLVICESGECFRPINNMYVHYFFRLMYKIYKLRRARFLPTLCIVNAPNMALASFVHVHNTHCH